MSVDGENLRGPLIVGVIPRQHPGVVAQAAFLAERLGRNSLSASGTSTGTTMLADTAARWR